MRKPISYLLYFIGIQLFVGGVVALFNPQDIIITTLLADVATITLFVFLLGGSIFRLDGYKGKRLWWLTLICFVIAISVLLPSLKLQEMMPALPNRAEKAIMALLRNPLGFIAIAFLGPIAEEIAFRGGILRGMLHKAQEGIHNAQCIMHNEAQDAAHVENEGIHNSQFIMHNEAQDAHVGNEGIHNSQCIMHNEAQDAAHVVNVENAENVENSFAVDRRPLTVDTGNLGKAEWRAIIITSVLFALVHFNPAQMPHAFLVGILLGWIYCRTGSVLPGIFYHIVNNSSALVIYHFFPDDSAKLVDIFGNVTNVSMAVLISLIVLGFSINAFYRLTRQQ